MVVIDFVFQNMYVYTIAVCWMIMIFHGKCDAFSLSSRSNRINSLERSSSLKSIMNPWDDLTWAVKENARQWFIHRAKSRGIQWENMTDSYKNDDNFTRLHEFKTELEDMSMTYPDYFIKPFHGYNGGNLNWQAAIEGEAATLSMSANYWPTYSVLESQNWLRWNITRHVERYTLQHHIPDIFKYDPIYETYYMMNQLYETPLSQQYILDIGCSFGISTEYLASYYNGSTIYGVDLSPYFLSVAQLRNERANKNIVYIHQNAEYLSESFENVTFDKVFIQFMFHEMPQNATQNVVKEVYRLLNPGGLIIIVDLNPHKLNDQLSINYFRKWAFEVTEPHIFEYYTTNMTSLLRNSGFRKIDVSDNDPLNSIYIAQK